MGWALRGTDLTALSHKSILIAMSNPVHLPSEEIRAFVAIELSSEIKSQLAALVNQFKARKVGGVRWVAVESIHLTLKFLGNINQPQLQKLISALTPIVKDNEPFSLTVGGTGAFPNLRKPRVIWVGVQAPPDLSKLQSEVETAAENAGIPKEERGFSPHLTIGRVRSEAAPAEIIEITAALTDNKARMLGSMMVDSFTLIRSDLRPQGPIYTSLARFSFQSKS